AVPPGPFTATNQKRIDELARQARLPAMYAGRYFADRGGLIAYGADFGDLTRRAAIYVDRILRGAEPTAQPVEQPTPLDLGINLKPPKALGLTIPPSVVARADEVIQ